MAGLDFFSLVCVCLCRQSLLHGRDSQSPGLGRSCPLALVLQTLQGQGGVRAVVLALPRLCSCALEPSCSTLGCFSAMSQEFKT